ncbi:MAG: hypothetical protein J5994_04280 [Ruminococcus sp.]|nr:hypothetical protein [Ruminococcus sp.]
MVSSFKPCFFGGYNKLDALNAIDGLTQEIYQLENSLSRKEQGKSYGIPPKAPQTDIRKAAWGGFDKDDVDAFISDLRGRSEELRAKLGE